MTGSQQSIFGVRIDDISTQEVQDRVERAVRDRSQLTIATVNPEIVLHARADAAYVRTLNAHALNIVDGVGLQKIAGFKHRVTGADLAMYILNIASQYALRVALIVRKDGLSQQSDVQAAAQRMAPNADISVFIVEPTAEARRKQLDIYEPHIVLVGLGFPEQERWVIECGARWFPNAVFLSVGGTFDYWTGVQPRAPRMLQRMGLEWLWRLCIQPRRIVRIFRAVILFPLYFWFSKRVS